MILLGKKNFEEDDRLGENPIITDFNIGRKNAEDCQDEVLDFIQDRRLEMEEIDE
jgi:hypothetical protein